MFLDRFRKKKKEEEKSKVEQRKLPDDLQKFRVEKNVPFDRPIEVYEKPDSDNKISNSSDRTELIIQKLETIDARLRLIEEKLKNI